MIFLFKHVLLFKNNIILIIYDLKQKRDYINDTG